MRIFDTIEYPFSYMARYEIIHRFPESGYCMVREGTQLIVDSSQNAILFLNGKTLDLFTPGNHTIAASNIPLLIDKIGKDKFNEQTLFSLEIYYVNMHEFMDEKWGISTPILVGNEKLGFTYIQGYGIFGFRVIDSRKFIDKSIDYSGIYRLTDIEARLRLLLNNAIEESIYEVCEQSNMKMAADILRFKKEIAPKVINKSKTNFEEWGLCLDEFDIQNLNIPSKALELLDDRGLSSKPAAMIARASIPVDPDFIFIIMSFDKRLDSVYSSFKTAASSVGLNALRVSDQLGDYRITDKIIENIHKAFLIIADMSFERPNVYFELSYARGLGKIVIETALEGTNLHFDVKDWVCIFYSISDQETLISTLMQRFTYELNKANRES